MTDGSIHGMLHYTKCGSNVLKNTLFEMTKESKKWCPFNHGKTTEVNCYASNGEIRFLIEYLEKYYQLFEYLEVNPFSLPELHQLIIDIKNPISNPTYEIFKRRLNRILEFVGSYNKFIYEKNSYLTCEECIRLDEAINSLNYFLFFSSVVMSVSAVESRLHYLIKKKDPKIYKNEFENATLGTLIGLFDDEQYKDIKYAKFKKMLPNEHKPLMNLLNHYRVFSAHPKSKKISHSIAKSILNLSFAFLLDEKLKIINKQIKHKKKLNLAKK